MDAAEQAQLLGKVLLAAFCGGFIGWQRDRYQYSAGLRTMALVATGAALFVGASELYASDRVASNVVTGVGFLGAGIIFREGGTVRGITTAATIWSVAAIGVVIGLELYLVGLVATVLVFVLLEMRPLTEYLSGQREEPPLPGLLRRDGDDGGDGDPKEEEAANEREESNTTTEDKR
jgi:putative Mg2+ transporter-C (MgtC) family protein